MTKSEYNKLLNDPRWKEKRLKILERDGNKCTKCEVTEKLQAHHLIYENDFPWESRDSDLITLCQSCHKLWHSLYIVDTRNYFRKFGSNVTFVNTDTKVKTKVSSLTQVISSKKIIDCINESIDNKESEKHYISDTIDSLIHDIANLQDVQDDSVLKITSKISGDFYADVTISINYKKNTLFYVPKSKKKISKK